MMLNDQPSKDDPLGRRPFADAVARIIATQTDPAPQVIAIDGAWGEGKTTVFRFLEDSLKKHDLKVMNFNPWLHDDEDTMIRAFALEFGRTLGVKLLNKREQLVESAQDKAEWFKEAASAIGAEKVGGLLHFGAKRLRITVAELMERVRSELNQQPRRFTILVDDSDRLELGQLMNLFRLIKLIADFEKLTFVLAMDCKAVSRTVGRRFEADGEGRRFLEKIIQVPVRLPTIPHFKLREFALDLIHAAISDLGVNLSESDVSRFRSSLDPTIMPLIRTPRSAKQYANVIRFSLGLLPGEVNPVDVMLLEGVRLFEHSLFEKIKETMILKTEPHWMDDIMEKQDEKAEQMLNALLDGTPGHEKSRWRDVLVSLFPSKLSQATVDEDTFLSWTSGKRVACDEYLIRYLAAVIPDNDVPDSNVSKWMALAESEEVTGLTEGLKDQLKPKTEKILVQKLRRIERHLDDGQRGAFALAVSAISSLLTLRERAWHAEVPFGQAAIFAAQCVGNLQNLSAREDLAAKVIATATSGMWAVEFFWSLPHRREDNQQDSGLSRGAQVFDEVVSQRLGGLLANRLISEIEGAPERPPLDYLRRICSICIRHGDLNRLRAWSKAELTRAPSFLHDFVSLIMNWMYSGEERQMEWPGDEAVLKKTSELIDVDWLAGTFASFSKDTQPTVGYPLSKEEATARLIALVKSANTNQEAE